MSGSTLGMTVEILVAVLLLVTIGYCALLNQRLKRLRADEAALKAMVQELVRASEAAERAVAAYRKTAGECDSALTEKLKDAEHFTRFITREVESGEAVLERLAKLSAFARANGLKPVSSARAKAAAVGEAA